MSKRVMVVDDSRFICEQMKMMLEGSGFVVERYCSSGEEALAAYPILLPDVVTMDIIMPGIDGLEASERLLQSYPDARIVMVSSLAYDDTEEKAAELGIKNFVYKPFEKEELLGALKNCMGE